MKKIINKTITAFSIILFTTLCCFSQDCELYVVANIDRMKPGVVDSASKSEIILNNLETKESIMMILHKHLYGASVFFNIQKDGVSSCIEQNATITILLNNDSTVVLKNSSKWNCDGMATMYVLAPSPALGILNPEYAILKTNMIKAIRISTYKGYVECDFTKKNSDDFINTLNCLTKYIK